MQWQNAVNVMPLAEIAVAGFIWFLLKKLRDPPLNRENLKTVSINGKKSRWSFVDRLDFLTILLTIIAVSLLLPVLPGIGEYPASKNNSLYLLAIITIVAYGSLQKDSRRGMLNIVAFAKEVKEVYSPHKGKDEHSSVIIEGDVNQYHIGVLKIQHGGTLDSALEEIVSRGVSTNGSLYRDQSSSRWRK